MIIELLDRRVLGAIEFVHVVTRTRIRDWLRVRGANLVIVRNYGGLYVIREAEGFDAYTRAFDAPPAPAPGDPPRFTLTVEDPDHRFLARSFSFTLPRKNASENDVDSVLVPLVVELYPAASAPAALNWAVLRARVQVAGSPAKTGLANALVRVTPHPAGLAPQLGLTDAQGEAFIALAGIPPVMPASGGNGGDDNVVVTDFDASVSIILDEDVVRTSGAAPAGAPDPQSIAERADPAQPGVHVIDAPDVSLASGRSRRAIIEVSWP